MFLIKKYMKTVISTSNSVDPKSDFRQEAVSAKTKKKKGKNKERQIFLFCGAARSIFWRKMDNMPSELHVASGFLKKD